jgi:very-short-patch-repair endonuclease
MTKTNDLKDVILQAAGTCDAAFVVTDSLHLCKSPIETKFGAALYVIGHLQYSMLWMPGARSEVLASIAKESNQLCGSVQAKVGTRIADFMLAMAGLSGRVTTVIIECDGRDYHDRDLKQICADKKRDRELVAIGHPTIRFAGSDIWRDPVKCATEAIQTLLTLHERENDNYYDDIDVEFEAWQAKQRDREGRPA